MNIIHTYTQVVIVNRNEYFCLIKLKIESNFISSVVMSKLSKLLRDILGEDCADEINIFVTEKVGIDLFLKLDRETLREMGKISSYCYVIYFIGIDYIKQLKLFERSQSRKSLKFIFVEGVPLIFILEMVLSNSRLNLKMKLLEALNGANISLELFKVGRCLQVNKCSICF